MSPYDFFAFLIKVLIFTGLVALVNYSATNIAALIPAEDPNDDIMNRIHYLLLNQKGDEGANALLQIILVVVSICLYFPLMYLFKFGDAVAGTDMGFLVRRVTSVAANPAGVTIARG